MKAHRMTDSYATALDSFLRYTTEKQNLLTALQQSIKSVGARSLLDIGAGNGDLAVPLSETVQNYIAIEPNSHFAFRLKNRGLTVFEAPFPWASTGNLSADIVVASHVVPWELEEGERFIRAAWRCVNPGGAFVMITYDEDCGVWADLLRLSGLPLAGIGHGHLGIYEFLLRGLDRRSTTNKITSWVETRTLEQMLKALAFVYSDGQDEKAEQFISDEAIAQIIQLSWYDVVDDCYRFPFTHYLLQVNKGH